MKSQEIAREEIRCYTSKIKLMKYIFLAYNMINSKIQRWKKEKSIENSERCGIYFLSQSLGPLELPIHEKTYSSRVVSSASFTITLVRMLRVYQHQLCGIKITSVQSLGYSIETMFSPVFAVRATECYCTTAKLLFPTKCILS
jgi:hypothetical protein